jgi:DNA-binding LytR/AlgR family response regulator
MPFFYRVLIHRVLKGCGMKRVSKGHRLRNLEQGNMFIEYFYFANEKDTPLLFASLKVESDKAQINSTQFSAQADTIMINTGNATHYISIADVLYCKAQEHFTLMVRITNRPLLSSEGIDIWDERLRKSGFIRIHRSFLANLRYCAVLKGNHGKTDLCFQIL